MTVKYNIIKNDDDFTDAWDKFATAISESWPWHDSSFSIVDYNRYFNDEMTKYGMIPGIIDDYVQFCDNEHLTMFLLKWT